MAELIDEQYGRVVVRRHRSARGISMKFLPSGELQVTTPPLTPHRLIVWTLNSSRDKLEKLRHAQSAQKTYHNGQQIGQSHRIIVVGADMSVVSKDKNHLIVRLTPGQSVEDTAVQTRIRGLVKKALRSEAEVYLPARLRVLAERYGFRYGSVRLAHQQTRWGSRSSNGTISLNIALMNLPLELIDYVLIHELSHTKHMNHSTTFWREVERCMPDYKLRRRQTKTYSPHL